MLRLGTFFQFGYVTTDLEAALDVYAKRFDAPNFVSFDTASMNPDLKYPSLVALGWVGDVQVELIQPKNVSNPLYADAMPKSGFGINFHHFGYMVDSEQDWDAVEAEIARVGTEISSRSGVPGKIDVIYTDARPLCGHYLEYVWARGEGREFLMGAPRNPPIRRQA